MKRRKLFFGFCWFLLAAGIIITAANVNWKMTVSGLALSVVVGLLIAKNKSRKEWDTLGQYGRLTRLLKEIGQQQPKH